MTAIWKRELQSYFYTPVGYAFVGVFFAMASLFYVLQILSQRSGDLPTFFAQLSYLWMLLSPILTMRLLAEEKQKHTDQLLLTSPVSLPGIVLGKYLAAVTVLIGTVLGCLVYIFITALYGTVYPAELAVVLLGLTLQGCAFAAMDLFFSGLAANPMTAALLAFGANLLLWLLDLLSSAVRWDGLSSLLNFFSLYGRNEAFLMGQLSVANILYDLSFAAFFLALCVFNLDRRRYRGGI